MFNDNEQKKNLLEHPCFDNHENVFFFNDKETGCRGIIAVHNTFLGPALGGCRIWQYTSDEEALRDVLRLSRGMTYKSALANLPLGGGKAVIISDGRPELSEAMLCSFAQAVNSLGGSYITAEDVGSNVKYMETIKKYSDHVVGLPGKIVGDDDGDPSPYTAYGVYKGMLSGIKHKYGADSVDGITVALQGIGHVGMVLCDILHQNGAKLIVTDINERRLHEAKERFNCKVVGGDEIYGVEAEVFTPCALGASVNEKTLGQLKAGVIAGAANNQLSCESLGDEILRKGIFYAPDFVINSGGIIKVHYEGASGTPHKDQIYAHIDGIYNTVNTIYEKSLVDKVNMDVAARSIVDQLLANKA